MIDYRILTATKEDHRKYLLIRKNRRKYRRYVRQGMADEYFKELEDEFVPDVKAIM